MDQTSNVFAARLAVVVALLGGTTFAAATAFEGAIVDEQADRDTAFSPDADCDLTTVEALAGRHPSIRQFIMMATDSFEATTGTVEVAVRSEGGTWRCQIGTRVAMFGLSGTRPFVDRRSGDGTTPAGVFPLGEVTAWDGETFSMFGNQPDPGVQVPYRSVRWEDCWGATPGAARYQHVVNRPGCSGPDEWLPSITGAYSHAAVIGANLDPISGDEPGEIPYAAAIFLHRFSYSSSGAPKTTHGCVSLAYEDLVDAIRAIDPDLDPHFAIGPRAWLASTA